MKIGYQPGQLYLIGSKRKSITGTMDSLDNKEID